MVRNVLTKSKGILLGTLIGIMALTASPAQAALDPGSFTADLNSLVAQGNELVATMSKTTLTAMNMGTGLSQLASSVSAYQQNVVSVYNTVASASGTFSLTGEMLMSLQNLATINASLGSGTLGLSQMVVALAPVTFLTTLQSSMTTMLQLSTDIGVMADRILEMADAILVMADNIGSMADRILATQVIQNTNIALVVDATLQTQQNMILLAVAF
ncbi:MAG TPA: hypothetical protein DCO77_08945 [Nitrospiraceae bacterium]|nr:hypothetical protein [Nitrospiraceae bacterium]